MAITSSAKKALRASKRKKVFNLRKKEAIETINKKITRFLREKKIKEAEALVPVMQKTIDKAVKTNFIKANRGARIKSRLIKKIVSAKKA